MNTVTAVLISAVVLIAFGLLAVWIASRSYRRNLILHRRSQAGAVLVAALAVVLYPVTLLYWLVGPTPERRR